MPGKNLKPGRAMLAIDVLTGDPDQDIALIMSGTVATAARQPAAQQSVAHH